MRWSVLIIWLLLSIPALAKRTAPPVVAPVEHDGVRYVVPNNHNGVVEYLEAFDIQTGTRLWHTIIYVNQIDSQKERDVQCFFIKELKVVKGLLVVTDERNRIFFVDRRTGEKLADMKQVIIMAIGILFIGIFIYFFLLKRMRNKQKHVTSG